MGLKRKLSKVVKFFNSKEKIAVPSVKGMESLLEGKTALISGGSSGIGFSIAQKLLSAGCQVIVSGSNEDKIVKCCEELNSDKVKGIVLNICEVGNIDSSFDLALKQFPDSNIDILINCAGYNTKKGFFDITEYEFDKTFDTNVKGTFFLCQAAARYMIKNKIKGHILNLSSSSALRPAWSPYEMSKWTIKGFTVGLADTLISHDIIVNAIAPGPTATPMLGVDPSGDIDLPNSPIKRYATPEEIANLALVLVSDMGNLIIGDTIYATGGSGVISLHK